VVADAALAAGATPPAVGALVQPVSVNVNAIKGIKIRVRDIGVGPYGQVVV
jgi:hypothetical protein